MSTKQLHVVPHDDHWAVKREGTDRVSTTHDTQNDAVASARELAHYGDRIVVHDSDGTIRDSITKENNASEKLTSSSDVNTVASVGTRVSWSAVLAGIVVAFAVYTALGMLSVALGVTTVDEIRSSAFAYSAVAVTVFNLLVSLFLGGFVVSRLTVGENKLESMTYGLLLWGSVVGLLLVTGAAAGIGVSQVAMEAGKNQQPNASSTNLAQTLNLTKEQSEKYHKVVNQSEEMTAQISPVTLAWVGFGAMLLSMIASIGGAVCGAGPELVVRQIRDRRLTRVKAA